MSNGNDILGLSFTADHLNAVRLSGNGIVNRMTAPLSVDLLADDPQLVAQELRERLQPLGKAARSAVVCLPLHRVMITTVSLPDLPEEAVASFLLLQAEREFLLAPGEMALGISRYDTGGGHRGALLAAMPISLYSNLQRTLRLAGVKRLQVTLAAAAPFNPEDSTGVGAFLLVGPGTVDFGVTAGGGIVMLRRLACHPDDTARETIDYQILLGEVRITLGQLPPEVRDGLRTVRVYGPPAMMPALIEHMTAGLPKGSSQFVPAETTGEPGDSLTADCEGAVRRLADGKPLPLVLAPIVTPRRFGLLQRWTRRQIINAAAGPVLLLLLVAGLVLYQQLQLSSLRKKWQAMAPRADVVHALITEAKSRRPWLNDRPDSLQLLLATTEAFPKRGTAWATRLEIKDRSEVVLAGKAVNREAWLQLLDDLRRTPGVRNLRVTDAHDTGDGKSPMTFSLGFSWQAPIAGPPPQEKKP